MAGPGHLRHRRAVVGHFTLGASTRRKHRMVPRSSDRQFRRPRPGHSPGIAPRTDRSGAWYGASGARGPPPCRTPSRRRCPRSPSPGRHRPSDAIRWHRTSPSSSPRSLDLQAVRKLGRVGVVRVRGRSGHPRMCQEILKRRRPSLNNKGIGRSTSLASGIPQRSGLQLRRQVPFLHQSPTVPLAPEPAPAPAPK